MRKTRRAIPEVQTNNEVFLENGRPSIRVISSGVEEILPINLDAKYSKLKPVDFYQKIFMYYLNETTIPLVICLGKAGCGKSFLALGSALDQLISQKIDKVYISKPLVAVSHSRFLGTLPGDLNDKVAPFMDSFYDVAFAMKKVVELNRFLDEEKIEFAPIEFLRGRSLEDCLFIVDEAQNLTKHELETVVSRVGKNSRVILLADPTPRQKDKEDLDVNLLDIISHPVFKESEYTANVTLEKRMRSPVIEVFERILEEV